MMCALVHMTTVFPFKFQSIKNEAQKLSLIEIFFFSSLLNRNNVVKSIDFDKNQLISFACHDITH